MPQDSRLDTELENDTQFERYAEDALPMIDVGDLRRFGFRIGPRGEFLDTREVSIFINGTDVSRHDRSAYLPSYVASLQAQSDVLKRCLNFEKYSHLFRNLNVTKIHNALLHGDASLFANDKEWAFVAGFHGFLQLNEPNTDPLAAFLIPMDNCTLCLTYQYEIGRTGGFSRLDIVEFVPNLLPYDLIQTIDAATDELTNTI